MEPRIIFKPAFTVVGLLQDKDDIDTSVEGLWESLGARLSEIIGADPDVGFEVHFMEEDGHRYLVGFAVLKQSTVPKGMTAINFDAYNYAVIPHQGSLDGIADTLAGFDSDWLPTSGYQRDEATYFEVYDDRFVPNSPDSLISIYVPLRKITGDDQG